MTKGWEPFEEVERGEVTDASFVANIWLVYRGEEVDERYRDPDKFFSRTFITDGLAYVLKNSASRVFEGKGDPVILLKTTFGGGKTHSLIGIYYTLLSPETAVKYLDDLKIPSDKLTPLIVAFDGSALDIHRLREHYGANNLWQFLFLELSKKLKLEEFERIYHVYSDPKEPPGWEVLGEAMKRAEECGYAVVFLLDEVSDFIKRLSLRDEKEAEAAIYFLDYLSRAVSERSDYGLLVISIPEVKALSSISERISELVQRVGRVASPKNLVKREDAAHILREALIRDVDSTAAAREVEKYFEVYRASKDKFPPNAVTGEYLERMRAFYPFHPQYVEILYDKIASLEQFQSTRDILRLTAQVLHSLCRKEKRKLVLLSDINMAEDGILNEVFERREGFTNLKRAVEADMEHVARLDEDAISRNLLPIYTPVYSSIVVFSVAGEPASLKDIALATATPDILPAMIESAVNTIIDSEVSYIHVVKVDGETRYIVRERAPWQRLIKIRAEKESYENARKEFERMFEEALRSWGKRFFTVIKFARTPRDIKDDLQLKLVFLDPEIENEEEEILNTLTIHSDPARGVFRMCRNSVVYVIPNKQAYDGAIKEAKMILAALKIKESRELYGLSEDDISEISKQVGEWRENLKRRAAAVFNRLAYPVGGAEGKIRFELKFLDSTNPVEAAAKILRDDGKVIDDISEDMLLRIISERYDALGEDSELRVKDLSQFFARDPERPYLLGASKVISNKIGGLVRDGKLVLRKGESVYACQKVGVGENDVVIPGKLAVKKELCVEYDGKFLPPPPSELKNPIWDDKKKRWIEGEVEEERKEREKEEGVKEGGEPVKPEKIALNSVTLADLIEELKSRRGAMSSFEMTIEADRDPRKTLSFVKSLSVHLNNLKPKYSLSAEIGDGASISLKLIGDVKADGIKEVLGAVERFGCRTLRCSILLKDVEVSELLKAFDIKLLREKYKGERFDVEGRLRE